MIKIMLIHTIVVVLGYLFAAKAEQIDPVFKKIQVEKLKDFDDRNHNISDIVIENGWGYEMYEVTT